jgi:HTH-type transcriptional regulator / antitoxin HigA
MGIMVRPIRNEEDYEAALAEVDALMGAIPDTPQGDRLDVLVTLIEAYEARHWAIDAGQDVMGLEHDLLGPQPD